MTRDFDEVFAIDVPAARRSPSTLVTDRAIEWLDSSQGAPLFLFIHYYDVHSDYRSRPELEALFTRRRAREDGSTRQIMGLRASGTPPRTSCWLPAT